MFTLLALLLALPAGGTSESPRLQLSSQEGDAFVPVGCTTDFPATFVLPLTTRSERVVRISPGVDGVAVRLDAPESHLRIDRVRAVFVPHATDELVLAANGELVRVGPPLLPKHVLAPVGGNVTDRIARLDGVAIAGPGLAFELPEALPSGARLVLFGAETDVARPWELVVRTADGATTKATLRSEQGQATILDVAAAGRRGLRLETTAAEAWLDAAALRSVELLSTNEVHVELRPRAALRRSIARRVETQRHGRGPVRGAPLADVRDPAELTFPDGSDAALELTPDTLLELWFEAPPETEATGSVVLMIEASALEQPEPPRRGRSRLPVRPLFTDVADALGMVHFEGPDEQLDIRPTMGPGAAWGDADGDGLVDLYLVQGGARPECTPLANRLYLNRRETFVDVTAKSGAGDTGAGMGALFFDGDGDGDLDLYVANYGRDTLLANDGRGGFEDVSAAAGLKHELWSASVVAADPDVDGDLDVYVTSYLDYDLEKMPAANELGRYQREDPIEMLPFAFPGQRNVYLRNVTSSGDGHPRFEDATEALGLADELGRGMQAVFWDFDDDGDQDLYVANDVSYNVLFRNEGDGTFRDVSFATGMDDPRGGMGVAVGDIEGDGDFDLFLTNWELEANAIYRNNVVSQSSRRHRVATFRDITVTAGLGPWGIGFTSWGVELFDADNDGDLDAFVANGYTSPDYESTGICIGQPNHWFENDGKGRFTEASASAGPALAVQLASRCVIACDYDQDGGVDLVVTANNGPVQLLHNTARDRGHWLGVRLRGRGGNTQAIGALVELVTPQGSQRRELRAGTGYLGGNAPELSFGIGPATAVTEVRVRWPDGSRSSHAGTELGGIDRFVTLSQP